MAAVYALAASSTHKNILVVIGHPNNFVRDDLPDRENEIEAAMSNKSVHLRRPRIVQLAFRLFMDEFRRNLAEELDIRAPVVDAEKFLRHRSEHSRDWFRLHSSMRTQSRQNRLKAVAKIFPRVARQIARAGMHAALVGRHNQHALPLPKLRKTFHKQSMQLLRR